MNLQRLILFAIAAASLCYGVYNQEPKAVMNKAAAICLECIGIG